jgi:hypothetical protein
MNNDIEEIDGLKPGDMSRLKLNWWEKFKLKFFPMWALKGFAKRAGVEDVAFDNLHEILTKTNRIDLFPLSGSRGFMIILDGKISLWFFQDGDHFKYDGFEIGEYDKGDVTIFDKLKN